MTNRTTKLVTRMDVIEAGIKQGWKSDRLTHVHKNLRKMHDTGLNIVSKKLENSPNKDYFMIKGSDPQSAKLKKFAPATLIKETNNNDFDGASFLMYRASNQHILKGANDETVGIPRLF